MTGRPLASVSLDLDDLWSYLKIHGDAAWAERPSYLEWLVPEMLAVFAARQQRITFFVVGHDAASPRTRHMIGELASAGHDIGNHSFEHEPWLGHWPEPKLRDEIRRADDAIERATGRRPVGFRGPGYGWSTRLLAILADRGYVYDSSTLPTWLGPIARAYYFSTSRLSAEERATRGQLFGTVADALRPVTPYRWQLDGGRTLLEIPVTVMPLARVPFHMAYLFFLAKRSERLARAYFETGLALCRATGVEPTVILHPLDFVGGDRVPALRFFPGMDLPSAQKVALLELVLDRLRETFEVVDLHAHARRILARQLRTRPAPAMAPAEA